MRYGNPILAGSLCVVALGGAAWASGNATSPLASVRAVAGAGSRARFVRTGDRFRVDAKLPLTASLPAAAGGGVELGDPRSGVRARFALRGAAASALETADGAAVYRAALAHGDVVYRADARGIEDFLVFRERPGKEVATYDLDVGGAAGLRQIGDVLELLDAGGAPRLRMLAPLVYDRAGAPHRAHVAIAGCAVDRNPAAPWGRAVTAPGAAVCALAIDWSASGVTYPAVVDPHWVATNDMAAPRADHSATLLDNGKVLVAGGGNSEASAELYDEGTNTFAATGAMTTPRQGQFATLLADGRVLLGGGGAGPLGFVLSTEIYDPATGTFTASGDQQEMHGGVHAVLLNDGKVLVAGGANRFGDTNAAELFDPATGQFSYTGSLIEARSNHTATKLLDGRVLVTGGDIAINPGELATAELYDPATGQFTATGSLSDLRSGHTATLLANGKVLVAGGYNPTNLTTEIYDPITATFSPGPDLVSAQSDHQAVRLGDGTVVIAGGGDDAGFTKTTQIYDPATNTVTAADPMLSPRANFTLTALAGGGALAAGGYDSAGAIEGLFSAEHLVTGTAKANGDACSAASECASGFCTDGVCCESTCDGQCEACNETGHEGLCEPVMGPPRTPRAACDGAGATCGGACDGTHRKACGYPAPTTACGSSCGQGMLTTSHCDGLGACAADAPVACPDGAGCADTTSCGVASPDAGSDAGSESDAGNDAATGKPKAASSGSDSGCAVQPGRAAGGALWLLAFGMALAARRRRTHRA